MHQTEASSPRNVGWRRGPIVSSLHEDTWYVPGTGGQAGHLRRLMYGIDPDCPEDALFLPPKREPTWEEEALIRIIIGAIVSLADEFEMRRYLIEAMDWFVAERHKAYQEEAEICEPFEGWLIERWITQIRGGRFRGTRQFQKMVEAYERERGRDERG